MPDHIRSDKKSNGEEFVVMAEIDLKFMKGDRTLAKAMGNKYPPKKTAAKAAKKTAKPKEKKK